MIQKLEKWCSFWIQKLQKYRSFWIQKLLIWTKKFLDPKIVEIVRFLDPETAEILQFLDPEIEKMDKNDSGCRNCRNGVISGSRNRRKGRQILYEPATTLISCIHLPPAICDLPTKTPKASTSHTKKYMPDIPPAIYYYNTTPQLGPVIPQLPILQQINFYIPWEWLLGGGWVTTII